MTVHAGGAIMPQAIYQEICGIVAKGCWEIFGSLEKQFLFPGAVHGRAHVFPCE